MAFQKHWYLGFLGFIGVYHLPTLIGVFQNGGSWWGLTGALWFLWFLCFLPQTASRRSADET